MTLQKEPYKQSLLKRIGLLKQKGLLAIQRPPFFSDLDTWHKGITDNDFAEKINNLPAKILPRIAAFNGIDDVFVSSTPIVLIGDCTICCRMYANNLDSSIQYILRNSDTSPSSEFIGIFLINNKISCYVGAVSDVLQSGVITNQWYDIIITSTSGVTQMYINNSSVGSKTHGVLTQSDDNLWVGANPASGGQNYFQGMLADICFYNRVFTEQERSDYCNKIIPLSPIYYTPSKGQGDYEYDISGNNNHGTWSGTGIRYDFDLNGSRYANDNGYSLWQKAASDDIQPPFDVNGDALSLTPGVDIPTGYTKTRDIIAGGSKWNMADCLVDFDPDGDGAEKVINGGFDADSDWTKGAGWTISGGNANKTSGTTSYINQNILAVAGKTYEVIIDISSVSGDIRIYMGGGAYAGYWTSAGIYTIQYQCTHSGHLYIWGSLSTVCSINNISVKEVLPTSIFDRTNETRQTATSRASIYYDSDNSFRYQINEIADPRIYDTFFETDYKNRAFGKVRLSGSDLIRYDEQLNYATKKTGADLTKVQNYCKIQDIYPEYGPELHTNANAASDPNGNEADAITGFTSGGSLAVFQSQSGIVNVGSYAMEANANSVPSSTAGFYIDLNAAPFNLINGKTYRLSFDIRHIGVGAKWNVAVGSTLAALSPVVASILTGDTIFATHIYEWVHDTTNTRYFTVREFSPTNDGGVYFDNFSVKERTQ